jgi:hypothetical protein
MKKRGVLWQVLEKFILSEEVFDFYLFFWKKKAKAIAKLASSVLFFYI